MGGIVDQAFADDVIEGAFADRDQKWSSHRFQGPPDGGQPKTLVTRRSCFAAEACDMFEAGLAPQDLIVIQTDCSSSIAIEFCGVWCDDVSDSVSVIWVDSDQAQLLLVKWEQDADAVRLGGARRKSDVGAADQFMFLSELVVSIFYQRVL